MFANIMGAPCGSAEYTPIMMVKEDELDQRAQVYQYLKNYRINLGIGLNALTNLHKRVTGLSCLVSIGVIIYYVIAPGPNDEKPKEQSNIIDFSPDNLASGTPIFVSFWLMTFILVIVSCINQLLKRTIYTETWNSKPNAIRIIVNFSEMIGLLAVWSYLIIYGYLQFNTFTLTVMMYVVLYHNIFLVVVVLQCSILIELYEHFRSDTWHYNFISFWCTHFGGTLRIEMLKNLKPSKLRLVHIRDVLQGCCLVDLVVGVLAIGSIIFEFYYLLYAKLYSSEDNDVNATNYKDYTPENFDASENIWIYLNLQSFVKMVPLASLCIMTHFERLVGSQQIRKTRKALHTIHLWINFNVGLALIDLVLGLTSLYILSWRLAILSIIFLLYRIFFIRSIRDYKAEISIFLYKYSLGEVLGTVYSCNSRFVTVRMDHSDELIEFITDNVNVKEGNLLVRLKIDGGYLFVLRDDENENFYYLLDVEINEFCQDFFSEEHRNYFVLDIAEYEGYRYRRWRMVTTTKFTRLAKCGTL